MQSNKTSIKNLPCFIVFFFLFVFIHNLYNQTGINFYVGGKVLLFKVVFFTFILILVFFFYIPVFQFPLTVSQEECCNLHPLHLLVLTSIPYSFLLSFPFSPNSLFSFKLHIFILFRYRACKQCQLFVGNQQP